MVTLQDLLPTLGQRTQVMGILNVTPDSFSDGGRYPDVDAAVEAGLEMLATGADLVDVGGESTRPGAEPVSAADEIARVVPVIEGLAAVGIRGISIDTTKAEVARAAVEAGASLVNDISAMTFDAAMPEAVAALEVPVVLSHTRGPPQTMQTGDLSYPGGVVAAVARALAQAIAAAEAAGVASDAIVLDPGIGFGKTLEDNLELLRQLAVLKSAGHPVLVGTSRKRFIGDLTGKESAVERDAGTAATVALAIAAGADLVRVHDVGIMVDVVRVADAIVTR